MFDQYSAIIIIMEEFATCRQSTYKLMVKACFESAKRIIAITKNICVAFLQNMGNEFDVDLDLEWI